MLDAGEASVAAGLERGIMALPEDETEQFPVFFVPFEYGPSKAAIGPNFRKFRLHFREAVGRAACKQGDHGARCEPASGGATRHERPAPSSGPASLPTNPNRSPFSVRLEAASVFIRQVNLSALAAPSGPATALRMSLRRVKRVSSTTARTEPGPNEQCVSAGAQRWPATSRVRTSASRPRSRGLEAMSGLRPAHFEGPSRPEHGESLILSRVGEPHFISGGDRGLMDAGEKPSEGACFNRFIVTISSSCSRRIRTRDAGIPHCAIASTVLG